uniref:Ankyrin repeat domain-containing protein n=1 Tax=Romanomermis culicivorax TaxID=13658 RepID=A0A915K322_ROMCU
MSGFVDSSAKYALHKAVFEDNVAEMKSLLKSRSSDVFLRDPHGNTPLHLAVMLNHTTCISQLLAKDAPVKMKNSQGWSPLSEAISYGNRPTITQLLKKLKSQARESIHGKKSAVIEALKKMPDFYLELKWDFHSWIPFVSSILPSDVCKIYKKGSMIRLNTTLINFNEKTWERGDVSFIYRAEFPPEDRATIWDNKSKVYQKIRFQSTEHETIDEVDMLMSNDITAGQVSTKILNFSRCKDGWIFPQPKTEQIGDYQADYYTVENLYVDTKRRREHLSAEDMKKNKAMMDALKLGKFGDDEDLKQLKDVVKRKSLPPPPPCRTTWNEYILAPPGHPPCLGRPVVLKNSSKRFQATVAMSTEFPLTVDA